MTTVVDWRMVPKDRVWALVARLKTLPETEASSSLHAAEMHIRDHDGTLYRYFRAMSDTSRIAADDEIEQAFEIVQPDPPKPAPLSLDSLLARLEAVSRGAIDATLDRDLRVHIEGPEEDGSTASPYALHPKLTRSSDACHAFMAEHRPDWRVASIWEVPDGWSARLTDRVGVATSPPEDFGRPKIEVRTAEAWFKSTPALAFIMAILTSMKRDNYRP